MGTYAVYTDVAAELGGVTITASSTPSSSTVDGWIQDAEREVEVMTGMVYATTSISSTVWEYHDYDGSGAMKLNNYPVQTIDLIQWERNGQGSDTADWVTLAGPGKTGSSVFELYKDVGAVRFHPNSTGYFPSKGVQNVRVAYTYGHTSVPREIKELVVKLASQRYISSVANNTGTTGGGAISVGAISISDPNTYVHNHLRRIDEDIDRLMSKVVGGLKVVNYELGLYE